MRPIHAALLAGLMSAVPDGTAHATCWFNCSPADQFRDQAADFKGRMGDLGEEVASFSKKVDDFTGIIHANSPSNVAELQKRVKSIKADITAIQEKLGEGGRLQKSYTELLTEARKWRASAKETMSIPAAERDNLVSLWDQRIQRIAASGAEIDVLRRDIASILSVVAGNDALLEQYAALQMVDTALKAMEAFIVEMKTFSGRLRKSVDFTAGVPTS